MPEELLAEANSYAETDNPEILDVRRRYEELLASYKKEISVEADQVRAAGGLFIIGTERHESRRIDNQLRGRSGRQGDPGESRFYLSLEDDVMRLFGSERIMGMMETLGIDEDTPIDQKILSNAVESAQRNVEGRNFRARKNVLEYDDVMNTQREVIYAQRRKVLDGENLRDNVLSMLRQVVEGQVTTEMAETGGLHTPEQMTALLTHFENIYFPKGACQGEDWTKLSREDLTDRLYQLALDTYTKKEQFYGEPMMRELERVVMLRVVDEYWMDQIDAMDDLKQGITLRAYAQEDPVVAYKREGYEMFEAMIQAIREETVRRIFLARIQTNEELKREKVAKEAAAVSASDKTVKQQPVRKAKKVGPNDPCPCGSGKKYKKCCRDKDIAEGRA